MMELWMLIALYALVMLIYLDPTMSIGATQKCLTVKISLRFTLMFSMVLLALTGLGMATSAAVRFLTQIYVISYFLPVFTFLILVILGSYMIIRSARKVTFQERLLSPMTAPDYLRTALAWGLPIYLTGLCVGLAADMTLPYFLIAFGLSFGIPLAGLLYGNRVGYRSMRLASAIEGSLMLGLAIRYIAPYAAQLRIPHA